MLSSPSHQQRQRDSLFPSVHAPSSSSSSSPPSSSSVAASFVRRSTKFSSRECSVSSVIYTTSKVRLAGLNHPPEELGTFAGSLAPNQCSKGLSLVLSAPPSLPPSNCVTLLHASDKITVLPPSKPFPPSTGQVHFIPIKVSDSEN
ncbi:hypothetical protein niasHT_013539 [Heterodera trifolii]|uniref:Uncharacterized protein n=1 Tax=Heterodera trifolii TaxID=157864 RepID=A0ABD2LE12_9BILA